VTEPLPLPLAPVVTEIHAALLVAVQLQPVVAVTVIVPVLPEAAALADVGEIDGAQGAPACVTVNVAPATVSVPVREALDVFAATV
jgi:hypothetical protein